MGVRFAGALLLGSTICNWFCSGRAGAEGAGEEARLVAFFFNVVAFWAGVALELIAGLSSITEGLGRLWQCLPLHCLLHRAL